MQRDDPISPLPCFEEKGVEIQREIFRRMSVEQKLNVAHQLYWSARALKAAAIKDQHPELTEQEVQSRVREIFLYARS